MDVTMIFHMGVQHLERLKNTAKHLVITVVGPYHLYYSLGFQLILLYLVIDSTFEHIIFLF